MTETTPTPDAPTEGVVMTCQRCGEPMPPLPDDLARLARRLGGVTLAHDVCPGQERPVGRVFEVRCQIVEVAIVGEDDDHEEELVRFAARVTADDLDAAMRPLAAELGEKWMKAERQAKVADGGAGL